jgi:hypothetical protein
MTDQELKDLFASIAVQQAALVEAQRETERRHQETDSSLKETSSSLKETERILKESQRETDRQFQESKQETDRQMRELRQQLGGLSDKFGSFTEGLALPSMTKILTQRFGMDVIAPRIRARNNGHSLELDVLAYSNSGDSVFIVEVKSHLREEALDQMRRILREFRDFFPAHRDKKVYGIIAAVDAPDELRNRVLAEGFYLAKIHDGQFDLQVPEGFQARAY